MRYTDLTSEEIEGYRVRCDRLLRCSVTAMMETQFKSAWRAREDMNYKISRMGTHNHGVGYEAVVINLLLDACYRDLYVFPYRTPGKECPLPAPVFSFFEGEAITIWQDTHLLAEIRVTRESEVSYRGKYSIVSATTARTRSIEGQFTFPSSLKIQPLGEFLGEYWQALEGKQPALTQATLQPVTT